MISSFLESLEIEKGEREDLALDLLWETIDPTWDILNPTDPCQRMLTEDIDLAVEELIRLIENNEVEPEPFTLLGILMITLPAKHSLKKRKALFDLACELFDEWEWDKEELRGLQ